MGVGGHGPDTHPPMSTVDPSTPRLPATETDVQARLSDAVDTSVTAVRGLAFWTTIPMPLLIVATLLSGAAPLLVAGLVLLNICCAVVGQSYSPNA